jgi:hypothetical protein
MGCIAVVDILGFPSLHGLGMGNGMSRYNRIQRIPTRRLLLARRSRLGNASALLRAC